MMLTSLMEAAGGALTLTVPIRTDGDRPADTGVLGQLPVIMQLNPTLPSNDFPPFASLIYRLRFIVDFD